MRVSERVQVARFLPVEACVVAPARMATSAVATLVKFNRLHESQYASDKLIKTVGFAAGFISSLLSRGMCGVCGVWVCASLCVPCRLVRSECGMPPAPLVDWPPLMSARTAWLTRSHITAHHLHDTRSLTLRHCSRHHDQPPPILCASHMWGYVCRQPTGRRSVRTEPRACGRLEAGRFNHRRSQFASANRLTRWPCGIVKLWP